MNQSALDGFVKIVEMDSFSAAAEALYLSQSALSQQIRTPVSYTHLTLPTT